MITLFFVICLIGFMWKCLVFGLKASWGIMKILCCSVIFPIILIALIVGGLVYIVLPIVIIGGIAALIMGKH